MKGFKKLFAETKRFYLAIVLLAILFAVIDAACIFEDQRISPFASLDQEKVAQLENSLATQDAVSVFQANSMSLASGFGYNMLSYFDTFRYKMAACFVMILLFIKNFAYTDIRAREFRHTWPVKSWVKELYDYVMIFVSYILAFGIQTCFMIVIQTRYNYMLVDVLGQHGDVSVMENIISALNKELVIGTICFYILPVLMMYTWLYLGMMLTRNPLLGAGIALVMWHALEYIWFVFGWYIIDGMGIGGQPGNDEYDTFAHRTDEIITCVFQDSDILYYYNGWYTALTEGKNAAFWDGGIIDIWLAVKLILILLFIISIVIAAKKRDLSKGKLLYFPLLDYPLCFLTGMFVFAVIAESWMDAGIAYVIGIIISIAVCLFIHPFRIKKSSRLEVK